MKKLICAFALVFSAMLAAPSNLLAQQLCQSCVVFDTKITGPYQINGTIKYVLDDLARTHNFNWVVAPGTNPLILGGSMVRGTIQNETLRETIASLLRTVNLKATYEGNRVTVFSTSNVPMTTTRTVEPQEVRPTKPITNPEVEQSPVVVEPTPIPAPAPVIPGPVAAPNYRLQHIPPPAPIPVEQPYIDPVRDTIRPPTVRTYGLGVYNQNVYYGSGRVANYNAPVAPIANGNFGLGVGAQASIGVTGGGVYRNGGAYGLGGYGHPGAYGGYGYLYANCSIPPLNMDRKCTHGSLRIDAPFQERFLRRIDVYINGQNKGPVSKFNARPNPGIKLPVGDYKVQFVYMDDRNEKVIVYETTTSIESDYVNEGKMNILRVDHNRLERAPYRKFIETTPTAELQPIRPEQVLPVP